MKSIEKKLCPLLTMALLISGKDGDAECRGEDCQWFDADDFSDCAIRGIADNLAEMRGSL